MGSYLFLSKVGGGGGGSLVDFQLFVKNLAWESTMSKFDPKKTI